MTEREYDEAEADVLRNRTYDAGFRAGTIMTELSRVRRDLESVKRALVLAEVRGFTSEILGLRDRMTDLTADRNLLDAAERQALAEQIAARTAYIRLTGKYT